MEVLLDSGAISALAGRAGRARVSALRANGYWPPVAATVACVEALTGYGSRDALTHRLLNACEVVDEVDMRTARQAAGLRSAAKRGSAIDALVVALASRRHAVVLTSDPDDLRALAEYAPDVAVLAV
jgi:predicted nucleic acid-binding protein